MTQGSEVAATDGQAASAAPHVSIVIPVYNEERILRSAILELRERLKQFPWSYEILVSENGSRDRTVQLAEELAQEAKEVHAHSLGEPNYGKALKQGILRARGKFVICDEIDLCDTDFYRRAMELLESGESEMVVGSKVMNGANDERPLFRHVATLVLNGMLRVAVGFKGTDTHGLKAFRRDALAETVHRCVVDKDLFASEFVVRAGREKKKVVEIPLRVAEKRKPSINLTKRVPNVLKNMVKLTYVIRVRG
ncbi:MAG: glycosyltransferase family 2 protein [Deltaproteobacteria bacterium]|nr:glycosyltransferase family 2 protein [Deltaproteobacteria bacterium]